MRQSIGRIGGLAALAGVPMSPGDCGASDPAGVEIVSDDCGGATLQTAPGEGFSVQLSNLVVESSEATPVARKLCRVQIAVTVPEGARALRGAFELSGSARIAAGARGSNVSVRYYLPGDPGASYFNAFDPMMGSGDFTGRSEGTDQWGACGERAQLTLLVDVTARSAAGDPSATSSVGIMEIRVPAPLVGECLDGGS